MQLRIFRDLSPGTAVVLALWILVVPIPWAFGAFLAAAVHELCHLAALKVLNVPVVELRMSQDGLYLHTAQMSGLQEGICAGAGPAGSLLLMLLTKVFPEMALCGFVQGIFNLLPLYPLDGGRILAALLSGCSLGKKQFVMNTAKWVVMFLLMSVTVWAMVVFDRYRLLLGLSAAAIGVRLIRKIPCKARGLEVQ